MATAIAKSHRDQLNDWFAAKKAEGLQDVKFFVVNTYGVDSNDVIAEAVELITKVENGQCRPYVEFR